MKRAIAVLAAAAAACLLAYWGTYTLRMRQPPEEWMGRRLGLEGDALAALTAAHNRYFSHCAEMCRRIDAAETRLVAAVHGNRKVTDDVAAALADADALRTECRRNMLAHFYEVAALLDDERQTEYLELVLPLVVDPGNMRRSHAGHE